MARAAAQPDRNTHPLQQHSRTHKFYAFSRDAPRRIATGCLVSAQVALAEQLPGECGHPFHSVPKVKVRVIRVRVRLKLRCTCRVKGKGKVKS